MAELDEAGTIKIGTKFDQPLFGLEDPDGEPVGFDVEIGKLIAAELGIDADEHRVGRDRLGQPRAVHRGGQVDLVIATYTINDERKQVVSFAGPYYVAGQDAHGPQGQHSTSTGPDDLAGKKVCSADGRPRPSGSWTEYGGRTGARGAYSECLEPLRNRQVDAVTTDNVILAGFVDQNPGDFKLVGETFSEEPYGIGLKKGDNDSATSSTTCWRSPSTTAAGPTAWEAHGRGGPRDA